MTKFGISNLSFTLSKKWKIRDIFYISLLKQEITRIGQIDEYAIQLEFEVNDNEKHKVKCILNSAIYAKKWEIGYLSRFYYLVFWISYPKKEITSKSASAV